MAFIAKSIRRSVLTSHHLLPLSFQICCRNTSSCPNNNNKTTSVDSTDPDSRYNVFTYQLPLSDEQQGDVLETLNSATLKDLTGYKLSNTAAQKLISARQKNGSFKHIRDLLLVQGLGLKRIESLCNRIVNFDVDVAGRNKSSANRFKKLLVPDPSDSYHKNARSIVGLGFFGSALCWCVLQHSATNHAVTKSQSLEDSSVISDTSAASSIPEISLSSWQVASLNCKELPSLKMELPLLHDQLCSALKEIPPADAYVLSDKLFVKAKMNHEEFAVSLVHEHLKGLLAIALSCRADQEVREDSGVVYYAKEALASKALVLKSSSQRMTGFVAARSLLSGCAPAPLPGLSVPPDIGFVYNNLPTHAQYGLNSVLISALSFTLLS